MSRHLAFLRVKLPHRRSNARILGKKLVQQRAKHPERCALHVRPAGAEEEVQMYYRASLTLDNTITVPSKTVPTDSWSGI